MRSGIARSRLREKSSELLLIPAETPGLSSSWPLVSLATCKRGSHPPRRNSEEVDGSASKNRPRLCRVEGDVFFDRRHYRPGLNAEKSYSQKRSILHNQIYFVLQIEYKVREQSIDLCEVESRKIMVRLLFRLPKSRIATCLCCTLGITRAQFRVATYMFLSSSLWSTIDTFVLRRPEI